MWTHYFTLRVLAEELDTTLAGASIVEIFTQQKNELNISTASGRREQSLTVSIDPKMNFLFLRDQVTRAKKNSADLFPEIVTARITNVAMHPYERIMYFHTDARLRLLLQLFGTAASNILLVDDGGVIKRAFKRNRELEGKPFEITHGERYNENLQDAGRFRERLLMDHSSTIYSAMKSAFPHFGSTYVREILHRSAIEEQLHVAELRDEDFERIHAEIAHLAEQLTHPQPIVYFRDAEPRVFSVVPLRHLSGSRAERFPSVNDAIRALMGRTFRAQAIEAVKNDLLRKLKGARDRSQRSLNAVREELAQAARAEEYERIGKVLMANLQHLTKGTKVVELEDIFAGGNLLRIQLDPKLTPAKNAERYFEKAKKARTARRETERRAADLNEKTKQLEKLLLHLDYCQTKEQLAEFQKEHESILRAYNIAVGTFEAERLPFRVFTVHGDFAVWVGKSGESNDMLTMKYAKPNDLWFHARGASGSHVVLKVGGGKSKPSREAIEQAASIAAYYSKMRNASNVPVAYCERKYVRKPKGAEPGTVVMEREKVILVEPGLP